MDLRILQLNIYGCTYFDNLKKFLKTHHYDVFHFQEVCGANTFIGNIAVKENNLTLLQKTLGPTYQDINVKTDIITSSPTASYGNSTFLSTKLKLLEKKIIWLKKNDQPISAEEKDYSKMGAAVIACKILIEGKPLWLLNTHLVWSPTPDDTEEKEKQSNIIANFLATLSEPFILTGDFNANSKTNTIKQIEKYGRNLTNEYHITNTLNARLHRVKKLFPPGLAVDFIFASKELAIKEFRVLEDDISDHLGLDVVITL